MSILRRAALFLAACSISLMVFSSCASQEQDSQTRQQNSVQEDSFSIKQDTDNSYGKVKQIGYFAGAPETAAGSEGLYILTPYLPHSRNLTYIDYETRKEVFLCNRPECKHNDDSCASFIDTSQDYYPGLLFTGHHLLIVTPYGEESFLPGIQKMAPDGQNRQTLFELKPNQNMPDTFFTDEEYLFFILNTEQSTGKPLRELMAANLQTGELKQLIDFGEEYFTILGAKNQSLYLMRSKGLYELYDGMGRGDMTDNEFRSLEDAVSYEVTAFDLKTMTLSDVLFAWGNQEMSAMMFGENLYAYNLQKNQFVLKDLESGQEKIVTPNFEISYPEGVFIQRGTIDRRLIVEVGEYQNPHTNYFLIDFDLNRTTPLDLRNEYNDKLAPVLASYGEELCVVQGYTEHSYPAELPDGQIVDQTVVISQYAMISTDDYISSEPNFSSIESELTFSFTG